MSRWGQAALALAGGMVDTATSGPHGPSWWGDRPDPTAPGQIVTAPLDDGLLTGRAGVALALAAAGTLPGAEPRLTSLAVETIGAVLERSGTGRGHGWLSGNLGVARAAAVVAHLADAPAVARDATRLAGRSVAALATGCGVPANADLLDGQSGVLLGVLAAQLSDERGRDRRRAAELLVAALRASAVRDGSGARWPMVQTLEPVAGMAHGAAGVALALSAARACGFDDDGLADEAITWEDGWYDAGSGGWPDLRHDAPEGPAVAWCHGALGIGTAAAIRARWGDTGEPTFRRAAHAALQRRTDVDGFDGTLCHGHSGVVELHLAAAQTWPGGGEHLRAARAMAEPLAAGVLPEGTSWTHGVLGGRTPEVLAGTSGVILTLVRCVDPAVVPEVTHPGEPLVAVA